MRRTIIGAGISVVIIIIIGRLQTTLNHPWLRNDVEAKYCFFILFYFYVFTFRFGVSAMVASCGHALGVLPQCAFVTVRGVMVPAV
jgi:hypothetical protein